MLPMLGFCLKNLFGIVGPARKLTCHDQDPPPLALVRTLIADLEKWYIASSFIVFLLCIFEGYLLMTCNMFAS